MAIYRLDVELVFPATLEVEAEGPGDALCQVYDGAYVIVDQEADPCHVEVVTRAREVADGPQS